MKQKDPRQRADDLDPDLVEALAQLAEDYYLDDEDEEPVFNYERPFLTADVWLHVDKFPLIDEAMEEVHGIGPTGFRPGEPGKIAVMAERLEAGVPLFHEDDAKEELRIL